MEYIIEGEGLYILENKYKYHFVYSRFEIKFGSELIDYCNELDLKIIRQYSVCNKKYRIDFYIPELNLAIEYDEYEHRYQIDKDKKRQADIQSELKCNFIRVQENMSVGIALGILSKYILNTYLNYKKLKEA